MIFKPKKSPYHGLWAFILFMLLPSAVMTFIAYCAISKWQSEFGIEFNKASSKIIGYGLGILFHTSCIIVGAFKDDFDAVVTRIKLLFENLSVSPKFALKWYWEDVKELGLALYIDLALMGFNIYIFVDALNDYFALGGKFL